VAQLRRDGQVPAVIYGPGTEPRNVSAEARMLEKFLMSEESSGLVDLSVDGSQPVKVLIQDVQRHPVKGEVTHVDFRQVKMDEEIEAEVEFNFVNESPAVKALGGILIRNMDSIPVTCLPADLVTHIDVDLSVLKEIDDVIRVGDLTPPAGIVFDAEDEDVIAVVNAPITEEELQKLEGKPEEADVESVEVAGQKEAGEKESGSESAES